MVTGATRDRLVDETMDALDALTMGVSEFFTRPLRGIATGVARLTRGLLTDTAINARSADVLRYLARGALHRAFLNQVVQQLDGSRVVVLGHSLGGVISMDVLVENPPASVRALVTLGSQAPFLYELGALPSLNPQDPLPDRFPPWLNFYDRNDALSYAGRPVFGDRVRDVEVRSGQPFPESHSAYFTNPDVWNAIEDLINEC